MSQIPGFQNIPDIDKDAMASGKLKSWVVAFKLVHKNINL